MSDFDKKLRFDELCAGRAMGDLSRDEEREMEALGVELGESPDLAFELLAASIELDFMASDVEPLPAALLARLKQSARELEAPQATKIVRPQIFAWGRIFGSPFTGWAAAAAILLLAVLGREKTVEPVSPSSQVSAAEAAARLRVEAADLIERQFAGLGEFSQATGQVVWSDAQQEGYMTLSGIPVNDPATAQYQLWIVDPTRDEAPVDGGVFDIPSDGSPVLVPITAKLALKNPQAFVITLEQPGGVVKSKQEKVVALAKG